MRVARIILLFLAIELFLGNLGLLGTSLNSLASATTILVFFALSLPGRDSTVRGAHVVPALALFATLAIIMRGSTEEVFVFPLLVSALLLLPPRGDHRPGERETLLLASFICVFVHFLPLHVPLAWHFLLRWGLGFSKYVGAVIGQEYRFGPTAAGLPILLLFVAYHVAVAIMGSRGRLAYLAKAIVLLILLQAAVILVLTPLAMLIQRAFPEWQLLLMNPEVLYFAAFIATLGLRAPESAKPSFGRRGVVAAVGILCLALTFAVTLRQSPGKSGGTVVIYNKGYLNFDVPRYGFYGYRSGGMFGYLPKFLESIGYRVEMADTITSEKISDADALVLINVMEYFAESEKQVMHSFVRKGGGLLVLGDHTGVMGIRGPYNDLLTPFGVEFLFDSATFILKGWGEEGFAFPHAITHGLTKPDEMEIWVGASLGIRPPARPVFIGKYGFSDLGDIRAIDKAYLGNRLFDAGEQLGDMVLVAATECGSGKVLVYGDTSTFQNLSMVTGYRVVSRVFAWLTAGANTGWLRPFFVLVLVGLSLLAVVRRDVLLAGVISCGVLVGAAGGLVPRTMGKDFVSSLPTAMIDAAHFPRFDRLTWFDQCIGGLQYNLMRAGYLPFIPPDFSEKSLAASKLLVEIAPVKPFSKRETSAMDAFMEKGGWILWSCGAEEKDGSWRFLAHEGIELLDVPLASFTDTVGGNAVQVQEGWGIGTHSSGATVLAERYGYPYVVSVRRGNGGLILIADSYFFLNKNVEGMEEYFEGNINFIRRLLEGIKGVKG